MAFQMHFTDSKTGAQYAQSYWIPVTINLNKQTRQGTIHFYGFVDAAARQEGKQKIASKIYGVQPAAYDEYFGPDAQNPEGRNPYSTAYELASAVLEGPAPAEGEEDTRVSFFAGASHV